MKKRHCVEIESAETENKDATKTQVKNKKGLGSMTKYRSGLVLGLVVTGLLFGCSKKDVTLPGERLDLRAPLVEKSAKQSLQSANDADQGEANRALPIKLPNTVNHREWTHKNGSAEHRIKHPALSANPTLIWSSSIGAGDNRKHRITADPVVSGNRIFTLDSAAGVMAHSLNGDAIWSRDLTPASDRSGDASGGGLAVDKNTLYVTTGFGALVALDVATGAQRWVQKLESAATGAPAVRDGLVYVTSRDSRAWAINAKDGRIKWQLPGVPTPSVMVGGTAPAVTAKFAVFPFGSGDLVAVFRKGGVRTWASSISGKRRGRAYAQISDITSDPVIDNGVVYAGSQSGRLVAIDLASGERIWTAKEGAYSPVWPVGGSVFLISDEAKLIRLDAKTGEHIWDVQLPYYTKEKNRRRKAVHAHYGPVLAGGRLVVAGSDGLIRSYNPVSGSLVSTVEIPGGATTNPVIVGATLYLVSTKGQLHAFR